MLATKPSYTAPHSASNQQSSTQYSSIANYRLQGTAANDHNGFFASPTSSDFSDNFDGGDDAIRNWGEDSVCEWLAAIDGCAQYVDLFKRNNINGENLVEMDHTHLKDIGINKMGHRLRISTEVKKLRNRHYKKASLQWSNRESLALLDHPPPCTPPSSASPRPLQSTKNKRMSRQITASDLTYAATLSHMPSKSSSRPTSPFVDDPRPLRAQAHTAPSPKRDLYSSHPRSGGSRPATTPSDTPQTARFGTHVRNTPSQDAAMTNSMVLPTDKSLIRVIYPDNARTAVLSIDGCKTPDDVILKTLKKGNLNDAHVKSYCFYVLDGIDPNPVYCRMLTDHELIKVITNRQGLERGRLIFRKTHTGEPDEAQLRQAANIATQQKLLHPHNVFIPSSNRSQLKIERMTGESLAAVSYPLSPASAREREMHINRAGQNLERANSGKTTASQRIRRIKELHGGRPPSELIASDLSTYFPDFEKNDIDRTLRMSIRRSRRLSKATSRLSMASNFSATSLKDAPPPLPSISDAWLGAAGAPRGLRPLSVVRLGGSFARDNCRDSVSSSVLEPLDEESPLEPNRKSYVSFSDHDPAHVTDPDGATTRQSYYDDGGSSSNRTSSHGSSSQAGTRTSNESDSLNKRLSQIVHDDSEESDAELNEYLAQDSWENIKYMKGALIGQGSFGSVYLALHAVTGELMAVKQVEMPSSGGTQLDAKKNTMVEALKHEIGLLRDLKHPNIVQYLGSNSDDTHLNIFLEYVPGGSVATMLVNYGPLGEGLIANFVRQILKGLNYLHSRDIIHRDIKGANILVDNKGEVKISDFGISKKVNASTLLQTPAAVTAPGVRGRAVGPRVSLQGSVFWMAPEVVKQTAYTRKADIWSLGCLIVEMFTGQRPHPSYTQLQAIFKIGGSGDASPTIPDKAGSAVRRFLERTFEVDYEKRPTAEELLGMELCTGEVRA